VSAPLIWIFLPGLFAVILFLLQHKEKLVIVMGTLFAILLASTAWYVPIGAEISLGPITYTIVETLTILGRRFVIEPPDRYILVLVYLGVAFWFGGAFWARCSRRFVPFGLGIAALLTAALAVEPFLYAALLIEIAVLASIPIITTPGMAIGRGALRFLIFNSLGFPFILFTGWLLAGVEASPGKTETVLHAAIMMGMGFAFLLAIFPFHTWIPMLAEEAHPYAVAFVFYELTLAVSLFGLGFLDRYVWLRNSPDVYNLLLSVGVMMVAIGGIWAAGQRHLGRMMGYAVVMEIGYSLLAVSIQGLGATRVGPGLFFALLLPRGLSLGVWALALVVIASELATKTEGHPKRILRFRSVQGAARRLPLTALALLLAHFSLAGLPLLAGFPSKFALVSFIARQSPIAAMVVMFGIVGFLTAGLRSLAVLVMGQDETEWRSIENIGEKILLSFGGISLFIAGLFPQLFTPVLARMAIVFSQLLP